VLNTYEKADVLALLFDNEFINFVVSKRVLHHTMDARKGMGEPVRINEAERFAGDCTSMHARLGSNG
jgi:hypothetical protein